MKHYVTKDKAVYVDAASYHQLSAIAKDMYTSLLYAPSSWEDDEHCIKNYKDRLTKVGVDV